MIARSFYFLRHGETDANVRKVLQGHLDTVLNATGRQQAKDATGILRNHQIDRIYASTLKRAVETADIVNQVLQKPVVYLDGLRENSFGRYEGLTAEEIRQWNIDNNHIEGPVQPETGFAIAPDGESYQEMKQRVLSTMHDVLDRHPQENILFVSHGRVFGMLNVELLGQDSHSKNAHPYHFECASDKWMLHCLVTPHQEVFCA